MKTKATSTAPADRLWEVISDVERWPELLETFTSVHRVEGAGETAIGDRFAVRQPGLRPAVYEITEWTAPTSFTWIARSPGVSITATHTIRATADGSELLLGADVGGPLGRVVGWAIARKAQRMIEHEATTLVRYAETGHHRE